MVLRRRLAFTTGLFMMHAVALDRGRAWMYARGEIGCCVVVKSWEPVYPSMDLPNKVRRGYSDRYLRSCSYYHCGFATNPLTLPTKKPKTLAQITYHRTSTLPLLHRRYSLPYQKIADGAIPTRYMRPTWTPYFCCKHLEKIARTVLNNTKYKRMWQYSIDTTLVYSFSAVLYFINFIL